MPLEAQLTSELTAVPLRSWTNQNDFHIREQLTKGSYGKVYLASHVNTGRDLIVKVRELTLLSAAAYTDSSHCTKVIA